MLAILLSAVGETQYGKEIAQRLRDMEKTVATLAPEREDISVPLKALIAHLTSGGASPPAPSTASPTYRPEKPAWLAAVIEGGKSGSDSVSPKDS